jgi:hypothetical protein
MFLTPYQTTACSATLGLPGIQSALQRALIHNELPPAVTPKGHTLEGVYLVPPYLKDIKPFSMPLTFETVDGKQVVAVDVRGITKLTGENTFKALDQSALEGAMLRGALTYSWINGGSDDMRRWNDIAARVYMRLLCETIVRRLNLTPADQQAVYVACGFFYFTNFIYVNPETGLSENAQGEKDRIAVAVARMTKINPQKVHDLLDEVKFFPTDLDKFCETLRVMVKNPRLEQMNAAVIITLMGGYWYGGNARQVMATSLEYPPVWLALIYQALMDRNYQGSQLSKMVDAENRNNTGLQFIRDMGSYLEILSDE